MGMRKAGVDCGRRGGAMLALMLALTMSPAPLAAQVASQITPGSFAPPVQGGLGGGIAVGAAPGLDTPAGAEKLSVTLRGVEVVGGFPALAPQAEALREKLAGRRVSGADIFAAARELEAAYAKAGYVLVRVTLPPQKLVDGAVLRLVVIDGFIERVDVSRLPETVRARIGSLLAPLVGQRGVLLRDLERRVLLAGDVPGVVLRSALAAGSGVGATVLVIEANYQGVNAIFTADNSLPAVLGPFQIGVGLDVNSALGLGELGYIRATGDPIGGEGGFLSEHPRNRILAAGFILPLGTDGLTFNVEGTIARTAPQGQLGFPGSNDQFRRLSGRLRYPWIRSRDKNFATQIVFDAEDEQNDLFLAPATLPLFLDVVRVLRVVNEADALVPTFGPTEGPLAGKLGGGSLTATLTPSFGLDVLGARTAAQATPVLPLSVQGADASFAKLDGTLGYSQGFAEHLTGSATLRGQTSFGSSLVRAEQIGLAGPGSLSAFSLGTLQGDSGVVGRIELATPFALPAGTLSLLEKNGVGVVLAPYAFVAGGEFFLQHPTVLELSHVRAASYGAGLRIGGGQVGTLSNGSLQLEYARQARSDGLPDDNRFNLVTALRF